MENDKLTVDLRKRNEMIKKYAARVTVLETKLVESKIEISTEETQGSSAKKSKGLFGSFFKKSKN
jgi:hypothetical protein